jgi:hypothetical protein
MNPNKTRNITPAKLIVATRWFMLWYLVKLVKWACGLNTRTTNLLPVANRNWKLCQKRKNTKRKYRPDKVRPMGWKCVTPTAIPMSSNCQLRKGDLEETLQKRESRLTEGSPEVELDASIINKKIRFSFPRMKIPYLQMWAPSGSRQNRHNPGC